MVEKILAVFGAITAIIIAFTATISALNYFIRESTLVANSIWELRKFKFKRIKKNGTTDLIDKNFKE